MPARSQAKLSYWIDGGADMAARLGRLKDGVRQRALRQAMRAIGSAGNKAARAALNKRRTGQLRKSLGFKIVTYRGSSVVVVVVGPRKGYRTVVKLPKGGQDEMAVDPVKYAHLVEGGRKSVRAKRGLLRLAFVRGTKVRIGFAAAAKAVKASPFLEPAYQVLRDVGVSELNARFWAEVERIAGRYGRRGKSIYRS